jgi:hypothetical protein
MTEMRRAQYNSARVVSVVADRARPSYKASSMRGAIVWGDGVMLTISDKLSRMFKTAAFLLAVIVGSLALNPEALAHDPVYALAAIVSAAQQNTSAVEAAVGGATTDVHAVNNDRQCDGSCANCPAGHGGEACPSCCVGTASCASCCSSMTALHEVAVTLVAVSAPSLLRTAMPYRGIAHRPTEPPPRTSL